MFDDFDYKKGAKGAGGLLKGVVKAISPESGTGMDEAGGGLGQILSAAGVELDEDEAPKESAKPPKKSTARKFEEHDFVPRAERLPSGGWREVQRFRTPDGDEILVESPPRETAPVKREPTRIVTTDREITATLLRERGWSEDEIAKILAGPTTDAKRISEAKAERIDGEDAKTDERAAISNAAAPARRVQPAKAKRITK